MEQVKPIEIPQSHIDFAKAVADLADVNGIAEFRMEYEPNWREEKGEQWDRRVRGKARIHFRAKDGRGRPCRNLSIEFDATVNHAIESNPESSN